MNYIEIEIVCKEPLRQILTAELFQLGYESFMETTDSLKAYLKATDYKPLELRELLAHYPQLANIRKSEIAEKNWNQQWEQSFEPIVLGRQCRVRASFHPADEDYPYDIIIDPKMSFGTGHHETTRLMMQQQLLLKHKGKALLDVGCGSGILSILASKMGARPITAIDVDHRAVESSRANTRLNQCGKIRVLEGTIQSLPLPANFQIILANINRNVLIHDIPQYSTLLTDHGHLILSGFYTDDQVQIVNLCGSQGLRLKAQNEENNWACLIFEKI